MNLSGKCLLRKSEPRVILQYLFSQPDQSPPGIYTHPGIPWQLFYWIVDISVIILLHQFSQLPTVCYLACFK